jgi:uncharacterized Zn-binding protein involved in type VI secretion
MSTIIQIKRSSGATAPTTSALLEGEMAYAQDASNSGASAKLYIESMEGGSAAIHAVGGKYFTDKVDARLVDATSSVGGKATFAEGTSNGSNKVTLKAPDSLAADLTLILPTADGTNGQILTTNGSGQLAFASPASSSFTISDNQGTPNTDTFSTGGTLTFAGSGGIKTTVSDNQIAIAADITGATALTSLADADEFLVYDASATANKKITAEDLGDYIYAGLSGDITVTEAGVVSIAANSVALGTDTTGNYVATVAGTANQIAITGSGSEDSAVTVALTNDVTLVGDLTVGGNDIKANGGTTSITLSGADVSVAGDLTVTGNDIKSSSATALTLDGANVAVAGDLTVTGNDIKSSSATALTLDGANVAVAGDLTVTGNDIKSSGGTTALTLSGANVTVAGNLTVSGTTTTVNSTTLTVTDPLVFVGNDNNATDAVDIGLFGMYDTSGSLDLYSGIFRDASDGKWRLFKDSQAAPTTTVNTAATGYTIATLVANLEGGTISSLASAITVPNGGTGVTTLTANGVLFGNGTDGIQATAVGTAGQVLKSGGSGVAPSFGNIDGGTY